MKTLNIPFEDADHQRLVAAKGALSYREFFMRAVASIERRKAKAKATKNGECDKN